MELVLVISIHFIVTGKSKYLLAYLYQFGKKEWLMPHVDLELEALVTGYLETVEEMAMDNEPLFLEAGGKQFNYIECLNGRVRQVELMTHLAVNQ
jgi:protoporphyrin/coproporphyrin ferrochelatase